MANNPFYSAIGYSNPFSAPASKGTNLSGIQSIYNATPPAKSSGGISVSNSPQPGSVKVASPSSYYTPSVSVGSAKSQPSLSVSSSPVYGGTNAGASYIQPSYGGGSSGIQPAASASYYQPAVGVKTVQPAATAPVYQPSTSATNGSGTKYLGVSSSPYYQPSITGSSSSPSGVQNNLSVSYIAPQTPSYQSSNLSGSTATNSGFASAPSSYGSKIASSVNFANSSPYDANYDYTQTTKKKALAEVFDQPADTQVDPRISEFNQWVTDNGYQIDPNTNQVVNPDDALKAKYFAMFPEAATPTATGDFSMGDVNNSMDSSLFSDALGTNNKTYADIQALLVEQTKLQQQLLAAQNPTTQEQTYQQQILALEDSLVGVQAEADAIKNSAEAGMNAIEEQAIPMQFIAGQQAGLERKANQQLDVQNAKIKNMQLKETNLINRLGLAQQERQNVVNAVNAGLSIFASNISTMFNVANMQARDEELQMQKNAALDTKAVNGLSRIMSAAAGLDLNELSPASQAKILQYGQMLGLDKTLIANNLTVNKNSLLAAAAKSAAETAALAPINGMTDKQRAVQETLRTNLQADVKYKQFSIIDSAYRVLTSVIDAAPNNAQASNAALVSFYNMINPNANLRDLSQLDQGQSSTLDEYTGGLLTKFLQGGKISANDISNFKNTAATIYSTKLNDVQPTIDWYKQQAESSGIDSSTLVPNFGANPAPLANGGAGSSSLNAAISAAKQADYSDQEILDYLNSYGDYATKINLARQNGYSPAEIVDYLAGGGGSNNSIAEPTFNSDLSKSKNSSYLGNYGNITGYGSPYWKYGLDVDLKKGDPVYTPVSGKIVQAGNNGNGFGNRVGIQTSTGAIVYLSHLQGAKVKVGSTVKAGQLVGLGGNTGKVIAVGGGDGSHLDITVKKPNGTYYSAREVANKLS